MIRLQVKTIQCKFLDPLPEDLREILYEELSFYVKNYRFTKKYNNWIDIYEVDDNGDVVLDEDGDPYIADRKRQWDGKKRLFRPKWQTFETGILDRVRAILDREGVRYTLEDDRPSYGSETPLKTPLETFKHQAEMVETIQKYKRLRLAAPPRSGKTMVDIDFYAKNPIGNLLFIVQQKELVWQTVKKFEEYLPQIKVGEIADGKCDISEDVNIATIQTLAKALRIKYKLQKGESKEKPMPSDKRKVIWKAISNARIVIVDEAHHSAATSYVAVLKKVVSAEYIIGQSGTPYREDNTELLMESVIGPVRYTVTRKELIDRGLLVPPKVRFYRIPPRESPTDHYQGYYWSNVVNHPLRNGIIAKAVQEFVKRGKSVAITVARTTHGDVIGEVLDKFGVEYELLYGPHTDKHRKGVLKRFSEKETLVVISTILHEGVDIPSLDAVIIAAGDKSALQALQRLRPMTPYPGKKFCYVIDFIDQTKYLFDHSMARYNLYNGDDAFEHIEIKDI